MSVFRINKTCNYVVISTYCFKDRNISLEAKGLYAYLCSYADNGCSLPLDEVCFDLNISKDTYNKYIKELLELGYIEREQVKENGKFSHNVYTILDISEENK